MVRSAHPTGTPIQGRVRTAQSLPRFIGYHFPAPPGLLSQTLQKPNQQPIQGLRRLLLDKVPGAGQ